MAAQFIIARQLSSVTLQRDESDDKMVKMPVMKRLVEMRYMFCNIRTVQQLRSSYRWEYLYPEWPVICQLGHRSPFAYLVTFADLVTCNWLLTDMLREMILTFQNECIQIIVPVLVQAHNNFQETHMPGISLQRYSYVFCPNSSFSCQSVSSCKFLQPLFQALA